MLTQNYLLNSKSAFRSLCIENAKMNLDYKKGEGEKISKIIYDNKKINGWFISHDQLIQGKDLVIYTE